MKIKKLAVYTSNLKRQYEFYQKVLEVPIFNKTEHSFTAQTGYSILEFHRRKEAVPYHIAFHIGANQEKQAVAWLKKRVEILKDKGGEIVDFPAWNAKSIYFYDTDRNIIEFIARKHLYAPEHVFPEKKLIGIAEIGLSTPNVEEIFRFLNNNFDLELYFGTPEVFCAIGDENGLLITVDTHRKTWFPTHDKALIADFDLKFEHRGKLFEIGYAHGDLNTTKNSNKGA